MLYVADLRCVNRKAPQSCYVFSDLVTIPLSFFERKWVRCYGFCLTVSLVKTLYAFQTLERPVCLNTKHGLSSYLLFSVARYILTLSQSLGNKALMARELETCGCVVKVEALR
jgi:hypothetical protein